MVYVDQVRRYDSGEWCHMSADTDAELEAFARSIGLNRRSKQRGHYDLRPSKRRAAVEAGAVEITAREMVAVRRGCELTAERVSMRTIMRMCWCSNPDVTCMRHNKRGYNVD